MLTLKVLVSRFGVDAEAISLLFFWSEIALSLAGIRSGLMPQLKEILTISSLVWWRMAHGLLMLMAEREKPQP